MRYVQMARVPGRMRIISSRVLGRRPAAVVARPIMSFLGRRDFFYLGIMGVVQLLVLVVAAVVGAYSTFHEKGLYFRRQRPEEHPRVDQWGFPLGEGVLACILGRMRGIVRIWNRKKSLLPVPRNCVKTP